MRSRDKIAHDYLIFRYPTEYLMIFFPVMVGVVVNVFSNLSTSGNPTSANLRALQFDTIDNYLFSSKVTIVILIAFFICYRWANMLNDGSYGFWLTAGVNRRSFYFRTIIKFTSIIVFAQTVGLLLVIYMNSIVFNIVIFLQLLLAISSAHFLIIIIAIYLGNRLRNPEFASILFLTLMGFNFGFNTTPETIPYFLFQSDMAYRSSSAIVSSVLTFGLAVILMFLGLRIHLRQDIDI